MDPTWKDKDAYNKSLQKLAQIFTQNFKQFEDKAGKHISEAGPHP